MKDISNKLYSGVTENNSGIRREKVMSEKNQGLRHTQGRKAVEVSTPLLGNDKNVIFSV